jgi:predicted adenylyl cyclase CyaB
MATNIEIKARIHDPDRLRELVERIYDKPGEVLLQEDTFFHTPRGRLKLRTLAPDRGQLIYYEREDGSGPKPSNYFLSPTSDPDSLKTVLSAGLGVRGVVRKRRLVYMVGNTRIHLDEVEGLGSFLELEVVLGPGESMEAGVATATGLVTELGIQESDLIQTAYIDLLESKGQHNRLATENLS